MPLEVRYSNKQGVRAATSVNGDWRLAQVLQFGGLPELEQE